ncbi:hypothetical protein HPP92_027075, partial [Vanilla planifolia]
MREMWKMAYGRMQIEFIRPVGCYISRRTRAFARDCPKLFELKMCLLQPLEVERMQVEVEAADLDNFSLVVVGMGSWFEWGCRSVLLATTKSLRTPTTRSYPRRPCPIRLEDLLLSFVTKIAHPAQRSIGKDALERTERMKPMNTLGEVIEEAKVRTVLWVICIFVISYFLSRIFEEHGNFRNGDSESNGGLLLDGKGYLNMAQKDGTTHLIASCNS